MDEVKRFIGTRIYSDSTLKQWKKDELIRYIRLLEDNYYEALEFNERQAQRMQKILALGEVKRWKN